MLRPIGIVFFETTPGLNGRLFSLYQWIALRVLPFLSAVVATSPVLSAELQLAVVLCSCVVLPRCLSEVQEKRFDLSPFTFAAKGEPLSVLFIGRLDSYKRLDWLLESLAGLADTLAVVGRRGRTSRSRFEHLAQQLLTASSKLIRCWCSSMVVLPELEKQEQIAASDVLVLPSDRSNEAFGIVQLEAMAAGRIALAFDQPRSGMGWVGQLPGLSMVSVA